jgi:hypothetical protein
MDLHREPCVKAFPSANGRVPAQHCRQRVLHMTILTGRPDERRSSGVQFDFP